MKFMKVLVYNIALDIDTTYYNVLSIVLTSDKFTLVLEDGETATYTNEESDNSYWRYVIIKETKTEADN